MFYILKCSLFLSDNVNTFLFMEEFMTTCTVGYFVHLHSQDPWHKPRLSPKLTCCSQQHNSIMLCNYVCVCACLCVFFVYEDILLEMVQLGALQSFCCHCWQPHYHRLHYGHSCKDRLSYGSVRLREAQSWEWACSCRYTPSIHLLKETKHMSLNHIYTFWLNC